MKYIISYDLGTGGIKASLYDQEGNSLSYAFCSCDTSYPSSGYHEQRPEDWWNIFIKSTKELISKSSVAVSDIECLAISGHSLGVVPIGYDGELLSEYVPIWSDGRATHQVEKFFKEIDRDRWYMTTGNGFPAQLYSIFKIMWYKDNLSDMYDKTCKFIGTKDYLNYKLTGILATDYSYASGSGVYNLNFWDYEQQYIEASGVCKDKLPNIYASTHILGNVLESVCMETGLSNNVKVVCGGVDNACMALGAASIDEGDAYTSLGTSAWIAVASSKPVLDTDKKPYVFTHCVPNMFVSATAIFAAGNSFKWIKENVYSDLSYDELTALAANSPIGSKKLIFNPSLAGGSSLDKSPNIRGGFIGLDLGHRKEDLIRSVLEGICLNLRIAQDVLSQYVKLSDEMLIVGGGGKSKFWRSLFADIYGKNIVETNVGQDAGSLGAAALAAVGVGLWNDFSKLKKIHTVIAVQKPVEENVVRYEEILKVFKTISELQSDIGEMLFKI